WSGWRNGCAQRARKSWRFSSSRRNLGASGNSAWFALADGRGGAAERGMEPSTAAVRLSPAGKEVNAAGTVSNERRPAVRGLSQLPRPGAIQIGMARLVWPDWHDESAR